jgi:hypothetical protein
MSLSRPAGIFTGPRGSSRDIVRLIASVTILGEPPQQPGACRRPSLHRHGDGRAQDGGDLSTLRYRGRNDSARSCGEICGSIIPTSGCVRPDQEARCVAWEGYGLDYQHLVLVIIRWWGGHTSGHTWGVETEGADVSILKEMVAGAELNCRHRDFQPFHPATELHMNAVLSKSYVVDIRHSME